MFCGKCGKQIADEIKFCPNCGEQIEETDSKKLTEKSQKEKKQKTGILIVFALVIMIVLAVCLILGTKEKPIEDGQQSEMNINSEDEQQAEINVNQEHRKAVLKSEEHRYGSGDLFYKCEYDVNGNYIFYQYSDYYFVEYEYEYSANILPITCKMSCDIEGEQTLYEYVYSYEYNELNKPVFCVEKKYIDGVYDGKTEITYQYDEKGNNLEQSSIAYDADGQITNKCIRAWNDKIGRWQNKYQHSISGGDEEIYTYNENGDIQSIERYRFEFKHETKIYEYVYDDNGNKIEEKYTVYDAGGEYDYGRTYYYEYEYDANGNILVSYQYGEDGDLAYVTYYTYWE